jgi:L-fuconolactonase
VALQRREVLKLAAFGAAGVVLPSAMRGEPQALSVSGPQTFPILDAHIHLFDPTRPGGVPWPTKADVALFKPALPSRYEALSAKHGIVGAIAIEASSLNSDNDWLLKIVKDNPAMVGMIGDLVPNSPSYMADLERLHRDPFFLGIRYGNLWDRDLLADLEKPGFIDGLKALASANLVFESANPDGRLIHALRVVGDRVPNLRIVIDHLPNAKLPTAQTGLDAYWGDLHQLAQRPQVFVKLSEIPRRKDGQLDTDPGNYRASLDRLWNLFGTDRVIFGSDWPNSDSVATFDETLAIVKSYMTYKNEAERRRYFALNSQAAYQWHPRRTNQHLV